MIHVLLLAAALGQTYSRTRMSDSNPASQCIWWKENTTLTIRPNAAGNPETPGDTEFVAIGSSISTWQNQLATCSSLTLTEGARTQSRLVEYDSTANATNENLVVFRQRSCRQVVPTGDSCASNGSCANKYDCWDFTDGAIAITTTSFSPKTAQIFDSDIELNTPAYFFTTVDMPVCARGSEGFTCVATDVQNTMTHELGHLLGLAHVADPSSTMSARAALGELTKRTLDPGSKRFVCDVYPRGMPSKTCFTPRLAIEENPAAKTGCTSAPGLLLLGVAALLRRRR